MTRGTSITVSVSALHYNFARVKALAPRSKILPVVKANGYGHGAKWVSSNLPGSDSFGVATIDEAEALRKADLLKPIVLLEGVTTQEELCLAEQLQCELVVHQARQLDLLASYAGDYSFVVWLKMNTGMNRLGFSPQNFLMALKKLKHLPSVESLKLMTHFACADDLDSPMNAAQLNLFQSTLTDVLVQENSNVKSPVELSCANSAATLQFPRSHLDWVRPGLMLYGVSPIAELSSQDCDLRPVMTLSARVLAIQHLQMGDSVGYAAQWRAPKPSTIAVVAIGYGDGYPLVTSNDSCVAINGAKAPIVGRVSMDMLTIDVTHLPNVQLNDAVELWGPNIAIEHVAKQAGTIPYELLCQLTNRAQRFVSE